MNYIILFIFWLYAQHLSQVYHTKAEITLVSVISVMCIPTFCSLTIAYISQQNLVTTTYDISTSLKSIRWDICRYYYHKNIFAIIIMVVSNVPINLSLAYISALIFQCCSISSIVSPCLIGICVNLYYTFSLY